MPSSSSHSPLFGWRRRSTKPGSRQTGAAHDIHSDRGRSGRRAGTNVPVRARSRRRAHRRSARRRPCPRSAGCAHATRRLRTPHRKEAPDSSRPGSRPIQGQDPGAGDPLGLVCGRTHEMPHANLVRSRLNLRGHNYVAHESFEVVVPARLDVGGHHVTRRACRRHCLLLQRRDPHPSGSSGRSQ